MRNLVLGMLCVFLFMAAGCYGDNTAGEDPGHTINVVATIYPLADIIKQLGGERISVSYLLPAGASPHTYEPTVEQARLIAGAQLFVLVGAGLDDWGLKLAEAGKPEMTVLKLADNLLLLDPGGYHYLDEAREEHHYNCNHHCEHHHEYNEHGCHGHGSMDPHFWLDPLLVRDEISPRLNEKLAALAPEHAAYFKERLDTYRRKLTLLHEEIDAMVSGFSKRDFLSFHSAWRYFAQRYGLNEVAVIAEFPGQEPSAGLVASLVELIKEKHIGAILTEPQFSPALAERIAEESGIKVLVVDPLGGENLTGRDSYLELMRFNLGVFKEALQ